MTLPNASDSSSDHQTETVAPEVPVTEAAPDAIEVAPSTTEPTGEKPLTLLDLVMDVAAKTGDVAPPTTEEQAAEAETPSEENPTHDPEAPTPSGEKDGQEGLEDKNDEKLPFHKHPRFQELVREKNSYKEDATQFRAIADYMAENRLTPDEVDKGFVIMSAIKNDPVRARQMLAETMRQLDEVTGEILGESESRMVDEGEMSEAAAKELSRYKAQVALQEMRQQEALREQAAIKERQNEQSIVSSVEQWEQQVATRDPDYAAKKSIVFDKIRLAQLERPAQTPQEALAYAEAAYRQATEILKSAMPKRVAINAPSSSQSVTTARAVPKNLADVVRMAAGL